jgi:alkylresorcinol/alkylpyrone synthase
VKTIIRSLATANPSLYVTQQEAFEVFQSHFRLRADEMSLYRKVLTEGPIRGRFVAMGSTAEAADDDQDVLVARFLKFGRQIAAQAAADAIQQAGIPPADIGAIVVNTCTGYLCPGLSSYLAETLKLSSSVRPLDIMGMGCGAALPNIEAAANILAAKPGRPVLSVAVEICSATIFMDPDPGVVVSNCIFGDGAAAAVVDVASGHGHSGLVRLLDFESGLLPRYRRNLQYRTEKHKLRNVLTREVPVIGARAVEAVARRLLERHGLAVRDIQHWIVHPGGTQVLDEVARRMDVDKSRLQFSYDIFAECGNMSSPSVLFVMRKLLDEGRPRRGEKGLMLTFGAGFTAFAALVEF